MTTIRQLQDGDYVQLADLFDSHISALQPGWGCVRAGCESASLRKPIRRKRHVRLLWLMEVLFAQQVTFAALRMTKGRRPKSYGWFHGQTVRRPWTCSLNTY